MNNEALLSLPPERQAVVRKQVRNLLERSDTFHSLPLDERRSMAKSLVNVVAYLSDPKAGQDLPEDMSQGMPTLAQAQAQNNRSRGGTDAGLVQQDFTGAAAGQAADVYKDLINAVDFPEFVSGLIDGVFNSIVSASIRQMEAYSKLLESVVKSVNEFATDNFTLNQGRDWLTDRFSKHLTTNVSMGEPKLELTDYAQENGLSEVSAALGLEGEVNIDDEESEAALAQRGQLEMARLRQKQLATMVLLGINRVIVTNGMINAKVNVDVRTSDTAERQRRASDFDSKTERTRKRSGGGWFSDDDTTTTNSRARTVISSSLSETSESNIDAKAKLTGEVRVNFKSETFPLEKMASADQITSVNQVSSAGAG